MSNRKIEVELRGPAGFTAEGYRAWAKANSIGHHVPKEEETILIIDGLWVYALTWPLKSWPTDPSIREQTRPGRWGGDRPETPIKNLYGRAKWRWYLLRTRPEAHGYVDPWSTEEEA